MMIRRLALLFLSLILAVAPALSLADDQVEMLYTFWGSAYEKEAQEAAIAMFNEQNPGVKVEALHIPSSGSEYIAKLTAMAASGTNPDVGYMDVPTAFVWAKEGKFYNIFDLMEEDPDWNRDMYIDDIFYMYEEDASFGTTSSINPRMIFYNRDILEAANVELPPATYDKAWTWDEFVDVAQQLTLDAFGNNAKSPDFDPEMIVQYGCYLDCSDVAIQACFLDSNNADILNEDGTACALNTPEAIEVYQAMYDLIYKYHVTPIPVEMSTIASDIPTALKGGQAAMAITGQWVLLDLAKMGINFDLGVLPKFETPRTLKQAGTRVIFTNAASKEYAWKLFKFLASPSGALHLYRDGLWMPVLKEWYENEELFSQWGTGNPAHPDSYRTVAAEAMFNGVATPHMDIRVANFAEIQTLLRANLDPLWLGSATSVEDQLNKVVEALNPLVKGYNPGCFHATHYHKFAE